MKKMCSCVENRDVFFHFYRKLPESTIPAMETYEPPNVTVDSDETGAP
jgi:hypothetical protein